MDISQEKFTNGTWETYNVSAENRTLHDHEVIPFDHPQWPPYYVPLIQNHGYNETSNSSISASPHLLGVDQSGSLRGGNQDQDQDQYQEEEDEEEELGAMKEMMFKIAAMQPVDIDPATIRKPRRRNVRISDDPQSVAARHRRERISEKIRILQRLVPGGTKMDTASMLDEAIRYVKFLKRQIRILQGNHHQQSPIPTTTTTAAATASAGISYLFGGNNNNDGEAGDDPMCFNHKFIVD